jgi:hypothetical protein
MPVIKPGKITSETNERGIEPTGKTLPVIPLTHRPTSKLNKRRETKFSEKTGDNVDKSTVQRKNFQSIGKNKQKKENPRPAWIKV